MYRDKWSFPTDWEERFKLPMSERESAYEELDMVSKSLQQIENLKYFHSCGTMLGILRDGRLLDWDTDIDFDVLDATEQQVVLIKDLFEKLGYKSLRMLSNEDKISQMVFYKEPYHVMDICFWYEEGEFYLNDVPESLYFKRVHPKKLYENFQSYRLSGVDFIFPSDSESYFTYLYGEDWRLPKKYSNWLKHANDLRIDWNWIRVLEKCKWRLRAL